LIFKPVYVTIKISTTFDVINLSDEVTVSVLQVMVRKNNLYLF